MIELALAPECSESSENAENDPAEGAPPPGGAGLTIGEQLLHPHIHEQGQASVPAEHVPGEDLWNWAWRSHEAENIDFSSLQQVGALVMVEAGVSLARNGSHGVRVDCKSLEVVRRRPSWTFSQILEYVPEDFKEVVNHAATRLFPSRRVHPRIAELWQERIPGVEKIMANLGIDYMDNISAEDVRASWRASAFSEDYARRGLSEAVGLDAAMLKESAAKTCGTRTLEVVRVNGKGTQRSFTRLACGSHRHASCASQIGREWAKRIEGQWERDVEKGRPPWVFVTFTVNRDEYLNAVEATRAMLGSLKSFWQWLRRNYGDCAYMVSREFHDSGWPHVHAIIRSRELADEMLAEAGLGTWERLVEACVEASERTGRRPCPFSCVRSRLHQAVVRCGLGRSGFWLEPARGRSSVAAYVTKESATARPCAGVTVAAEVTKTRQVKSGLLPRYTRRFQPSGKAGNGSPNSFFLDEAPGRASRVDAFPERVERVAIHYGSPEQVRERLESIGVVTVSAAIGVDFTEGERTQVLLKLNDTGERGPALPVEGHLQPFLLSRHQPRDFVQVYREFAQRHGGAHPNDVPCDGDDVEAALAPGFKNLPKIE